MTIYLIFYKVSQKRLKNGILILEYFNAILKLLSVLMFREVRLNID